MNDDNDVEKTMAELALKSKAKELSIVQQIAMIELGISGISDERELCERYGISTEMIHQIRTQRRKEINDSKFSVNEGQYRVLRELNERMKLLQLAREAAVRGDEKTLMQVKLVNEHLKDIASLEHLSRIWNLYRDATMPNAIAPPVGPPQTINIMNNPTVSPALVEAQKILEERRAKRLAEKKVVEQK